MKLILAQGNPGTQYARTRHNAGFMVLDSFADAHALSWKPNKLTAALTAEYTHGGEKILLVKPQAFYNQTGPVAQKLVAFYKLDPASDVLVIHDELALPFGTLRVRQQGSDAGNNGIKSLNQHLGQAYWRIRMGIYNPQRDILDDADFVLNAFSEAERNELPGIVHKAVKLIDDFTISTLSLTTHT